jgi:hypothetical protein
MPLSFFPLKEIYIFKIIKNNIQSCISGIINVNVFLFVALFVFHIILVFNASFILLKFYITKLYIRISEKMLA